MGVSTIGSPGMDDPMVTGAETQIHTETTPNDQHQDTEHPEGVASPTTVNLRHKFSQRERFTAAEAISSLGRDLNVEGGDETLQQKYAKSRGDLLKNNGTASAEDEEFIVHALEVRQREIAELRTIATDPETQQMLFAQLGALQELHQKIIEGDPGEQSEPNGSGDVWTDETTVAPAGWKDPREGSGLKPNFRDPADGEHPAVAPVDPETPTAVVEPRDSGEVAGQPERGKEDAKYPELVQELDEIREKSRLEIGEDWGKIRRVENYSKQFLPFVAQKSADIQSAIDSARSVDPESKRIPSLELVGRMLSRIEAHPKTQALFTSVDSLPPRPELPAVDLAHLNSLDETGAKAYTEELKLQFKGTAETYRKAQEGGVKSLRSALSQFAYIAGSLHGMTSNASDQEVRAIEAVVVGFDDSLKSSFKVQHMQINPGQSADLTIIEPSGGVYTDDPSKEETVASVTTEGYTFDPILSRDIEGSGDILQQPKAEIYSTHAPKE